jgi:hypothetical protein
MALDDILIKIRTTFEGKGAQEASKSLDALDQSSRRAAPALEKTGAALGGANKSARVSVEDFTRAARSASALTGSMEGIGAMAQQVASRFAGVAAALPVIGLAIAAFTAWKAAITAVTDAQAAQAASLRDITATNSENAIRNMAKAFDDLQASIASAAEEQKRFVDGQQAMADAQKALTLANIDAAEQGALAKEADPLQQALIKARFAEQRSGVTTSADTDAEARKADMLDRQRVLAELSQSSAKEQIDALRSEFVRASAYGSNLASVQQRAMDAAWTPKGVENAGAKWQPERERNAKVLQDLADQMMAARKASEKAGSEAEATRTLIAAQLIRVQASRVSATTANTTASASTTKATTDISVAELAAQKSAAESQLSRAQGQAATAQDYLATVPERIASGTYSQADQNAMLQALASAQEQTALLQSFISRIGQEMSKQNEILRTIHTGN